MIARLEHRESRYRKPAGTRLRIGRRGGRRWGFWWTIKEGSGRVCWEQRRRSEDWWWRRESGRALIWDRVEVLLAAMAEVETIFCGGLCYSRTLWWEVVLWYHGWIDCVVVGLRWRRWVWKNGVTDFLVWRWDGCVNRRERVLRSTWIRIYYPTETEPNAW